MLVLSRKANESIVIREDIIVEVIQVKRGVVKLAIRAPKDVKILRGEIKEDADQTDSE